MLFLFATSLLVFMKTIFITSNYWNKFQFCEIIHTLCDSIDNIFIALRTYSISLRNFVLFIALSTMLLIRNFVAVLFETNFSTSQLSDTQHPASAVDSATSLLFDLNQLSVLSSDSQIPGASYVSY